jgi:hypothetical protein
MGFARARVGVLLFFSVVTVGACSKGKTADAEKSENKTVGPLPGELAGDYRSKLGNGDEFISLKPTGFTFSTDCKPVIFDSLSCAGQKCTWTADEDKGSFLYDPSSKELSLQTKSEEYCHQSRLGKTVTKVDYDWKKVPANLQGTWYSCDSSKCGKAKLVLSETGITISGSGGKCENAVATLKSVVVDGPKTEFHHSGLTSNGWSFAVVTNAKGFELTGASTFNGNYAREGSVAGKTAADKPKSGSDSTGSGGDCKAYVSCVCDLSDALSSHGGAAGSMKAMDCDQTKKAYGSLGAMGANGTCKKMLDSYKETLGKMAPLYKMQGITIPSSCQ